MLNLLKFLQLSLLFLNFFFLYTFVSLLTPAKDLLYLLHHLLIEQRFKEATEWHEGSGALRGFKEMFSSFDLPSLCLDIFSTWKPSG